MKPLKSLSWLLLIAAVTLSSCHPTNDDTRPTDDPVITSMRTGLGSLEGEWTLTHYLKKPLPPNQQNRVTLQLTNRSGNSLALSGLCFVNSYGGTLKVKDVKDLTLLEEDLYWTDMAGTPEDMEAETHYFKALQKATYFEFPTSGKLALYLGDKANPATEVMYFIRK